MISPVIMSVGNDEETLVLHAKIRMALAEAHESQHDILFLSLDHGNGSLIQELSAWINSVSGVGGYQGKVTLFLKSPQKAEFLASNKKIIQSEVPAVIKAKDLNSIMLIGKNIAIFENKNEISLVRTKPFIDAANKIIRLVGRISQLAKLEIEK